tara:strand:+ start:361 stop:783 length:423 start_codon:yes stop_codon:yes gene_type:complete
MFSFLKNKNEKELKKIDVNYVALELLISFALADGTISEQEEKMILGFINKKISDDENEEIYHDSLKTSSQIISLHDQVQGINSDYSVQEKLDLLKDIWTLIISDERIDKYEENLFYRIGDLMKIKRSKLNQIKNCYGLDK